jgi:hypothetical protein
VRRINGGHVQPIDGHVGGVVSAAHGQVPLFDLDMVYFVGSGVEPHWINAQVEYWCRMGDQQSAVSAWGNYKPGKARSPLSLLFVSAKGPVRPRGELSSLALGIGWRVHGREGWATRHPLLGGPQGGDPRFAIEGVSGRNLTGKFCRLYALQLVTAARFAPTWFVAENPGWHAAMLRELERVTAPDWVQHYHSVFLRENPQIAAMVAGQADG